MSMTVNFYKYTGNPKKIHKAFAATYASKTISPTDFYDDQQPQLILAYDATLYGNANYCTIDTDYYFITDRALDTGNRMVFFLEKDLLTTYKTDILGCKAVIGRSSSAYNSYMADQKQGGQVNYTTFSIPFDITFDYGGWVYVAAIGGG